MIKRKKIDRYSAYWYRYLYRCSWIKIAGFLSMKGSSAARWAALTYAKENKLQWPIERRVLSNEIVKERNAGGSWLKISNSKNISIQKCKDLYRKYNDKNRNKNRNIIIS